VTDPDHCPSPVVRPAPPPPSPAASPARGRERLRGGCGNPRTGPDACPGPSRPQGGPGTAPVRAPVSRAVTAASVTGTGLDGGAAARTRRTASATSSAPNP